MGSKYPLVIAIFMGCFLEKLTGYRACRGVNRNVEYYIFTNKISLNYASGGGSKKVESSSARLFQRCKRVSRSITSAEKF